MYTSKQTHKHASLAKCSLALLMASAGLTAHAQYKLEYAGNTLQIGGRLNIAFDHTELSGFTSGAANDPGLAATDDRVFGANASRINFTLQRTFANQYVGEIFIDSSLNPTAGSGTLAGRENWLGVTGPFGRFRAGRIDTPVKQMGGYTDVFYATGIADNGQIEMMGGEDQLVGFTRRQQKSLRYDTPKFNGFDFAVQLGLPNADGSAATDAPSNEARKGTVLSTSLNYASGPFSAGIGYEIHKNLRYTSSNIGLTDTGLRLGAKYVLSGMGDIGFGANLYKYEGPNGTEVTRPFTEITGNIYAGSGKIVMRYAQAGNVGGSAPDGTIICGTPNAAANFSSCSGLQLIKGSNSGATQTVIGYDYAIDKQTSIYGYFTNIQNDANANYNYGTNGYGTLKPGNSLQGISIGAIYIF
jgi:predicted porin